MFTQNGVLEDQQSSMLFGDSDFWSAETSHHAGPLSESEGTDIGTVPWLSREAEEQTCVVNVVVLDAHTQP
jgi:hypothetical protein